MSILLELSIAIVQRAYLPGLEPPGDAVKTERVVASSPRHSAVLAGASRLVGLTLDAMSMMWFLQMTQLFT